jgi:hypothetical protein
MIRILLRNVSPRYWREARGLMAGFVLALVWMGCTSHPLTQPTPQPEQQTNILISVAPNRLLDLVLMIDNSPSMAPKQQKLKDNFLTLLTALQDPTDGTLPDLRVAIIDSDLGTGGQQPQGSNCGPNDRNGNQIYGDMGKFQMINATGCGVTSADAKWLEYSGGHPLNYTGDINKVFACLAGGLGTDGCGFEHQLQAFEFAFLVDGLGNDIQHKVSPQNPNGFLRANAYLGLVFLSDEDDDSAHLNDGMFSSSLSSSTLANESASLRASTRAHQCGGKNLTGPPPLPGYPTTTEFTAPFADCAARMGDECSNQTDGTSTGTDTSVPTDCNPLKSVHNLAQELKSLKGDPDQILVAGIFGWPRSDADMAKAVYKIAKLPNPNKNDAAHPYVFDYWPVCYDPNHLPKNLDPTTQADTEAIGYGATGGLRMSAFIDEFGNNGLKYSICEPDFSAAMKGIGDALAKRLQNLCVDYKLIDTDLSTPGVQADCRVVYRTLNADGSYTESPDSMPQCDSSQSDTKQSTYPCWELLNDTSKCPVNGQLIKVVRDPAVTTPLAPGTKVSMQCRTCVSDFPVPGC